MPWRRFGEVPVGLDIPQLQGGDPGEHKSLQPWQGAPAPTGVLQRLELGTCQTLLASQSEQKLSSIRGALGYAKIHHHPGKGGPSSAQAGEGAVVTLLRCLSSQFPSHPAISLL